MDVGCGSGLNAIFRETRSHLIGNRHLCPGDSIQTNVNRLGGSDKFLFVSIDFVKNRYGTCSLFFDRQPDFQLVADSNGTDVIRFGMCNHEDERVMSKKIVQLVPFEFKKIFERVMDKTELAREIENPRHIGVVHSNFVLGDKFHIVKNTIFDASCEVKNSFFGRLYSRYLTFFKIPIEFKLYWRYNDGFKDRKIGLTGDSIGREASGSI